MFSNFVETTSIRLDGIMPEVQAAATPRLAIRLVASGRASGG